MLLPWDDMPDVAHGFFGRAGGVSTGPFSSLNMSYRVGDDRSAVDENWRRVGALIGASSPMAMVNQVHGNEIHLATSERVGERPQGDGMVTAEPGIMLGILTADCVPVLMFDTEARVAGALHGGWRGTIAGIATRGIRSMVAAGADPKRIRVALGPSIGWCCFEVGTDVAQRFEREVEGVAPHLRPGRPGKAYLNLRSILADQLQRAGVRADAIIKAGPCTRCDAEHYFSRRAAGGAISGLQLSFIGFAP